MIAQELRIGNWVLGHSYKMALGFVPAKISMLGTKRVQLDRANGGQYENIKPIPLTEEILLKCGAVEQSYHWDFMGYFWKFEAGSLIFHDENYYGSHLPGCDFLHELQNLYFIIEGEELDISL